MPGKLQIKPLQQTTRLGTILKFEIHGPSRYNHPRPRGLSLVCFTHTPNDQDQCLHWVICCNKNDRWLVSQRNAGPLTECPPSLASDFEGPKEAAKALETYLTN